VGERAFIVPIVLYRSYRLNGKMRSKESVRHQGCPVIAMANRCNELSRREIWANSHRNDIFSRRAFSDKNGAPDPPQQNGGCHRAAPSSLS
jgi:hypothetical protein